MSNPLSGASASRPARTIVRWLGVGLVGLVVVVVWATAAGASPDRPADDPDEWIEGEAHCLKNLDSVTPDMNGGLGSLATVYQIGSPIESARRQFWALQWMGLGVPGSFDPLRLQEDVTINGPRWYVDQAKHEVDENRNCALARHTPTGRCAPWRASSPDPERRSGRNIPEGQGPPRNGVTGFLPDECWGEFPADAYDLHYDNGGFFSWDRKVWAAMTGTMHSVGKGAIQIALSLLTFAFGTFQVLDYQDLALIPGDNYQTQLIELGGQDVDLVYAAYRILFGYVAFKALRGKLAVAGGELVLSLVLATLGGVLMANRAGYLAGAADTMDQVTYGIIAAGNGQDPDGDHEAKEVLLPAQQALFGEFVDRPFDYIHFGKPLPTDRNDPEATCTDRRNRILFANVPDDGGWASRYMSGEEACEDFAEMMGKPTQQKMLVSLMVACVCLGVATIVGLGAMTLLAAKILLLVGFAFIPFAALAGILPGLLRRGSWAILMIVLQAMMAVPGVAVVMSFLLLALKQWSTMAPRLGPIQRYAVLIVLLYIVYKALTKVIDGTKKASSSVGDALTRSSPAAAHWQGGGSGGVDLLGAQRGAGRYAAQHGPMVGLAAAGGVYGAAMTSYNRRAGARLALKNLKKGQRYKEAAGHDTAPPRAWSAKGRMLEAVIHRASGGRRGRPTGPDGRQGPHAREMNLPTPGRLAARVLLNPLGLLPRPAQAAVLRGAGRGTVAGGALLARGTVATARVTGRATAATVRATGHATAATTRATGRATAATTRATGQATAATLRATGRTTTAAARGTGRAVAQTPKAVRAGLRRVQQTSRFRGRWRR